MQAAEWYLDLQAAAIPERRTAFADWLRRSPVHVEEFLRIAALHADLGRLPELARTDVEALVNEVARAAGARNVVELPVSVRPASAAIAQAPRETPPQARRAVAAIEMRRVPAPRAWRYGIAAGIAASVVLVGFLLAGHNWIDRLLQTTHYTTGIGEQRSIQLRDGSHVQINVRSDLVVRVDPASRNIRLEDGEALFRVAKDPKHPFRVRTPNAVIEAKGTQFDVRVRDGKTVVVLLEGRVEVSRSAAASAGTAVSSLFVPAAVTLDPGQMVTIAAHASAALRPRRADVAAATAWLQHRLVFDDAPLSQVIEEFNRYSHEQVVLDDPSLGDVRITASFAADNAPIFARSVAAAGNLRVMREADGTWHIDHR